MLGTDFWLDYNTNFILRTSWIKRLSTNYITTNTHHTGIIKLITIFCNRSEKFCHITPQKEYGKMANKGTPYFNSNTKLLQFLIHWLYWKLYNETIRERHWHKSRITQEDNCKPKLIHGIGSVRKQILDCLLLVNFCHYFVYLVLNCRVFATNVVWQEMLHHSYSWEVCTDLWSGKEKNAWELEP